MSADEPPARRDTDDAIRLPYAVRPTESEARRLIRFLSGCLGHTPTAVIAVILVAPILLGVFLEWFRGAPWLSTLLLYECLFLPGALKRRSALGACLTLVPAGLITLWSEVDWFAWMQEWEGYRPFAELSITCLPLIALAIFETVLVRDPPRRRVLVLIWYVVGMLSVACVLEIARLYIWFADISVARGYYTRFSAVTFSHPLLMTSLPWILIAFVNTAFTASKRNMRLLVICCALAPAMFVFWTFSGAHRLAQRSVREGSPFALRYAVLLLGDRGYPEDWRILRNLLVTAHEENQSDTYDLVLYWLRRHEPARTAKTVASLLSRQPSWSLATKSAELLLQHHQYSAAPLLLRYALLGDSACLKSLEDAGEPRAALVILMVSREFDMDARVRMARLLGRDVGSAGEAWEQLYDQVIDELPSPFPGDIEKECDRVVGCMVDFAFAVSRKAEFVSRLRTAASNYRVLAELESIEVPDFDMVSTDDLERAVRSYEIRVDELIQAYQRRHGERP